MDGILVMPDAGDRSRHFINHKRSSIDSRLRLNRATGRSRPGTGGRGHADCRSNGRKAETRRARDIVTPIGGVVIHVALPRVRLAPGVLMRGVILNFEVVARARIRRCVQVADIDENPMRCPGVSVAGMVFRPRISREESGKWIYPRS